jgi:lysyl-tRNA synthetase class 2
VPKDWQPSASLQTLKQRAQMLQDIRAFFDARDVLEVETPALSQAANTDPFIESFPIHNQPSQPRYLHTSPEYPMKRLLAAGSGDIYQISKVWRKGEVGAKHNPEFTLLEWYRIGFDYWQLIDEANELLCSLFKLDKNNSLIISYQQLFLEKFNINPHTIGHAELVSCVKSNIAGLDTGTLTDQALLDALLTHCIEPGFATDRLTVVIDYPASQSALAKLRTEQQITVAMRFEVYLGQLELGNGYQEETDYTRNKAILDKENHQRPTQQKVPVDVRFLEAIKAGMPPCSGIAIGLDRVLMKIADKNRIDQVISFPWESA